MSARRTAYAWCALAWPACAEPAPSAYEGEQRPKRDAASRSVTSDAGSTDRPEVIDDEPDAEDTSSEPDATPMAMRPSVRTSLVLPELWTALDAKSDPFADRLPMVRCLPGAVAAETLSEERVLGVDTGPCNYLTALQPTLRDVQPGDTLKVRLWHFELSAPEQAEAHAAVMIDDLTVLDERVPIPQPGGLIVRQVVAERAIPAGTPVYFHLHNHGENSWALVEVSTGPAKPN